MSEELSELLGILSGDGCLESCNYGITVVCGRKFDEEYVREKVAPMFENLFGVKPAVFFNGGGIHCRAYSKKLHSFLSETFAFPIGEKKNRLRIPSSVFQNKEFLKAFLRGLFDTDGGFHRHHKKSAMIQITSYSVGFRTQVFNALKELDFKPSISGNDIYVCDKHKIDEFFRTIGSKNLRNLRRYFEFKNTGVVPLQKEMAIFKKPTVP